MGNQLTSVVSVNLADVSPEYDCIAPLGEPGRSYVTSFHCIDRVAIGSGSGQGERDASALFGTWKESSEAAALQNVRLDKLRRRRERSHFVKRIYRRYTGGGHGKRKHFSLPASSADDSMSGLEAPSRSSRTNSPAPMLVHTTSSHASHASVADASGTEPTLHGSLGEHYEQFRDLFLHRNEVDDSVGTAASYQSQATPRGSRPPPGVFMSRDLEALQRAGLSPAARQIVSSAVGSLGRLGGGGGGVANENTSSPCQDVVVKVFVMADGGSAQQQQQQMMMMAEMRNIMSSVGEQLSAVEATRAAATNTFDNTSATPQDAQGAEPVTPAPTHCDLDALLPTGAGGVHCRGSSVLYYTRLSYQEHSRFSLLQRPFVAFSLPERLQTRPYWGFTERLFACFQLLRALQELHDTYGVVHGDIKPNNLLVQTSGWLYLCDLALYKPTHVPANNPAMFGYYYDTEDTRVCYLAPEKFVTRSGWAAASGEDVAGGPAESASAHKTSDGDAAATAATTASQLFPPDGMDPAATAGREGGPPAWSSARANIHGHTIAMDVFSAGCVMVYILTGEHLLHLPDALALRGLSTESERASFVTRLLTDKGIVDANMMQLLTRVLSSAPEERPTARQLLEAFSPRVFPVWFADLYDSVLPSLLSQPADVQLQWLHSPALQETVAWCAERAAAPPQATADERLPTPWEVAQPVSHLLLPIVLGAAQTAATNDAALRGLLALKNWFVPHTSLATLLDAILPFALAVVHNISDYSVPTRLIALRVLMAIGMRVTQNTMRGAAHKDAEGLSASPSLCGAQDTESLLASHAIGETGMFPTTISAAAAAVEASDASVLLAVTCEGLLRDILLPSFTELVRLASIEHESLLVELAQQLPTLLLFCRFALEEPTNTVSTSTKQGHARRGDSTQVSAGTHSFGAARQHLLANGWELLQCLYKETTAVSSTVVATLLQKTPEVVAFLGEERVHRDLLPLLTTLITCPHPAQLELFPHGVSLHSLLAAPQPEVLHFFLTEGLRQDNTLCVLRTLEALTTVLVRQSHLVPAPDMMPCVHQVIPLLLSPLPLVFRAASIVVATAARVYRPGDVTVYLEAAIRPLLVRQEWPLAELDRAPRSVIRADLLTVAAHQMTSSAETTSSQALTDEERCLLLEHVQLRRTLTETTETTAGLAHTSAASLFSPINPFVVARMRSSDKSAHLQNTSFSTEGRSAAQGEGQTVVTAFEKICPSVLLIPTLAPPRTGPPQAEFLARYRNFFEPACASAEVLCRWTSCADDGLRRRVATRQLVRGPELVRLTYAAESHTGRERAGGDESELTARGGFAQPALPFSPACVCACPSRPLRSISAALASASAHMSAIHSITPLTTTPGEKGTAGCRHVLLSAGARAEAVVWHLTVDAQAVHGNLEVLCRVPAPLAETETGAAHTHGSLTYLAAQRLNACGTGRDGDGPACSAVALAASDGCVYYYDAEQQTIAGHCAVATADDNDDDRHDEAGAVTCLDVHSNHTLFAGTARGVLALIDTRTRMTSPSAQAVVWSAQLDAAEGPISCLSALHFDQSAYGVVTATYGGFASLFDLRYQCCVAKYDLNAGVYNTAPAARPPSVLTMCPDPCTFAHSLRARFAHPGPALLLGASDGQAYRLQLRTGEFSVALQTTDKVACGGRAVRAMLCQPSFGCVVTGSEDGVLRQWQLPPCSATPSLPGSSLSLSFPGTGASTGAVSSPSRLSVSKDDLRRSDPLGCPPIVQTWPCERVYPPTTLVSSTPGYLLDEAPSLWPEATALTGAPRGADRRESHTNTPFSSPAGGDRRRHRVPASTNVLFPTVSMRERSTPSDGRGGEARALPGSSQSMAALPPPRHHKDAVLSLATLWTASSPGSGLNAETGPFLVSGSRDGTLSVWQNESA